MLTNSVEPSGEKQAPANRAAVTEETKKLVADQFDFEDLGEREVKGVGNMRVFSPVKDKTSQPS